MEKEYKSTRPLEQIKWIAAHKEMYEDYGGEEVGRLMEQIEFFADNLHTYPNEAVRVYRKFRKLFENNPFGYIFNYGEKEEYLIFSKYVDAYFILYETEEVPIGMLRDMKLETGTDLDGKIQAFFQQKKQHYFDTVLKEEELEEIDENVWQTEELWKELSGGDTVSGAAVICGSLGVIYFFLLYCVWAGIQKYTAWIFGTVGSLFFVAAMLVIGIGILNYRKLKEYEGIEIGMETFYHNFTQCLEQWKAEQLVLFTSIQDGVLEETGIDWNQYWKGIEFIDSPPQKKRWVFTWYSTVLIYSILMVAGVLLLASIQKETATEYTAPAGTEAVVEE